MMLRALAVAVVIAGAAPANAAPKVRTTKALAKTAKTVSDKAKAAKKKEKEPQHDGAHARVAYAKAGELRTAPEVIGRAQPTLPLTLEEEVAAEIEKLLRGPLRKGVTGFYAADARSGEALFAVNPDDSLNPASNVKMVSTATALELLGPNFRYTTRLLGREADKSGTLRGDIFLLGTWDPTLSMADMDSLAQQVALRGIRQLEGDVLVGSDPTRDGIYRAMVPIEIVAGEPGEPPTVTTPAGFDLIEIDVVAKTDKRPRKRHRLTFKQELLKTPEGRKRIKLTIGGTIGKEGETMYPLYTRERTAVAAHALRAALRAHSIVVTGDVRVKELGDFIGDSVGAHGLPIELARHESNSLQDIVTRVNKWSVNWLADRVIMTAAALARRTTPSMDVAVEAMYAWLQRHPQITKGQVVVDTGSGLSYRTRMTPSEVVKIIRAASGYQAGTESALAKAWHDSLSVGGTDGTLRHRFRMPETKGQVRGKTGSLKTVIALSGLLELDPTRPVAFSIITNTLRPLKKGFVRKAHEQIVALLAKYVAATAKPTSLPDGTQVKLGSSRPLPSINEAAVTVPDEVAEPQEDPELDAETARTR